MQVRHVFVRQLQARPLHPKASSCVVVRYSTHDSQPPNHKAEDGAQATDDRGGHELHDAAHQATHRISEKLGFAVLERAFDRLLGRAAGAGERVAIKAGERAVERVGERAAQQAAARAGERAAARVAAGAGERVAERAGERAAAGIAERVGERAGERLLELAGESAAARGAEAVLSRGADRLGAAAAQRTVERAAERVGQKGASVTGEKLAERALEQAARHAGEGGSRAALEHLGERIALRLGRGMAIAVPALGSLFVLHMVRSDRRRAREEQERGNTPASQAFWLAFLCDASDVAAHVVIVTSLLHSAYGVGPGLPHHWLHAAEWGGVGVAVVSTIAAVVGEMLAAGWRWRQAKWPQRLCRWWWNEGAGL